MIELETLGAMNAHQLDCVFILRSGKRYSAARFAKILEVLEKLCGATGFSNWRTFPCSRELQHSLNRRATCDLKSRTHREKRGMCFLSRNGTPGFVNNSQDFISALNLSESG